MSLKLITIFMSIITTSELFLNKNLKIGLFDSGIGGFSVLIELFKKIPEAEYLYVADEAFAPYGPKSDEVIFERSKYIVNLLLKQEVDLIVVACNTATAVSIDGLRNLFPQFPFVGVEPYLKSFQNLEGPHKKMVVLTTISTGKSTRFKLLKERLDPTGEIAHFPLPLLASLVEEGNKLGFDQALKDKIVAELQPIKDQHFNYAILGCTHYPLVAKWIEEITGAITLSPCPYVAKRVSDLLQDKIKNCDSNKEKKTFKFLKTSVDKNEVFLELNREILIQKFHLIKNI